MFLQFAQSFIGYSNDVMFPKKSQEEPDAPGNSGDRNAQISHNHTADVTRYCDQADPYSVPPLSVKIKAEAGR